MRKAIFSLLAGGVAFGSAVFADTLNGIEFVRIEGANGADNTGYGQVNYTYWIGQTEVSYAQYSDASGIIGGSKSEDHWVSLLGAGAPAVNVSWNEAAQYCNWLSSGDVTVGVYSIDGSGQVIGINRNYRNGDGLAFVLPKENEWYKAAYYNGSGYNTYANLLDALPAQGTEANYGTASSAWAVGAGADELNSTFNMMGNVWEPTEDTFSGNPIGSDPNMIFRGGAYDWSSAYLEADTRSALYNTGPRDYEDISVGFRVAAIPEPGTISLMSMSTVGLFMTRRIRRRKRLGNSLLPVRAEYDCDAFCAVGLEHSLEIDEVESISKRIMDSLKQKVLEQHSGLCALFEQANKAFWNRMVVVHERKLARRIAVKQKLKKNALACFDAFLALIMK